MANLWKQFESLLPRSKQVIGKLISNNGDGFTCTIQLLSGNNITVIGSGDVNTTYLVVNGVLDRAMENKTIFNEIIY